MFQEPDRPPRPLLSPPAGRQTSSSPHRAQQLVLQHNTPPPGRPDTHTPQLCQALAHVGPHCSASPLPPPGQGIPTEQLQTQLHTKMILFYQRPATPFPSLTSPPTSEAAVPQETGPELEGDRQGSGGSHPLAVVTLRLGELCGQWAASSQLWLVWPLTKGPRLSLAAWSRLSCPFSRQARH